MQDWPDLVIEPTIFALTDAVYSLPLLMPMEGDAWMTLLLPLLAGPPPTAAEKLLWPVMPVCHCWFL